MGETSIFGIAAGAIKKPNHIDTRLLDVVEHITLGSITLEPRDGNPEPTYWFNPNTNESRNSIGLKNQGLIEFLEYDLEVFEGMFTDSCRLRVSFAPTKATELERACKIMESYRVHKRIAELEINAACPNHHTDAGRSPVLAYDPDAVSKLLQEALSYAGPKALKIAPETSDEQLLHIIKECETFGVQTIVSGNTKSMSSTVNGIQRLSMDTGGMAGAPLFELAFDQFVRLRRLNDQRAIPRNIIACGGVMNPYHVHKYMKAGAESIQLGTYFHEFGANGVRDLLVAA